MTQRNTVKLMALGLFVFLLGLPALASAQVGTQGRGRGPWNQRDNRRNNDCDDRDYRNGDYRNGNYGYNSAQLRSSVRQLKELSKTFQRHLDDALDNSRYDDRDIEDRINQTARDFRDAASRLESRYDNGRDLNRSANEAREVIRLGEQLDSFVARNRLDRQVQNDWYRISDELEVIADAYGYDYYADNGNYNRNNRNNRNTRTTRTNNGGWRNLPNVIGSSRWPF